MTQVDDWAVRRKEREALNGVRRGDMKIKS